MTVSHINRLSGYLRNRFGGKVRKVPLDAGFTCPNRDGSLGSGGCLWCDPGGSGPDGGASDLPWEERLRLGTERALANGAVGTLAYFQAYTNTYGDPDRLEALYRRALSFPGVLGLAVGTRPDALSPETLGVLSRLARETFLWVEIGMQTSRDETLTAMKRCHGHAETIRAMDALHRHGIRAVLHLILGLPGESDEDMTASLRETARLNPWGVKFHPLMILRGSGLEAPWRRGACAPLSRESYVRHVADGLELLSPEVTIHRMTGERPEGVMLAPDWCRDKSAVLGAIASELLQRGTEQGSKHEELRVLSTDSTD